MIMEGGELEFVMGNEPNKEFGADFSERPVQKITESLITPVPYFEAVSKTFEQPMEVELADVDSNITIRWGYDIGQDEPALRKYTGPIKVKSNTKLVAVANSNGKNSFMEEAEYVRVPEGRSIKLKNAYSPQYAAGGEMALINTLRGGDNFATGNWQGYQGVDLDATIDLGKEMEVKEIGTGFIQNQGSWIFMPKYVDYEISTDGVDFTRVGQVHNDVDEHAEGAVTKDFVLEIKPQQVRYLRIFAKNIGVCPDWHRGSGNPAWIFADEIWVK